MIYMYIVNLPHFEHANDNGIIMYVSLAIFQLML